MSEVSDTLTEVAGLAAQGVELLLVGPLLIVGRRDDEEAPSPAEPATVQTTQWHFCSYAHVSILFLSGVTDYRLVSENLGLLLARRGSSTLGYIWKKLMVVQALVAFNSEG